MPIALGRQRTSMFNPYIIIQNLKKMYTDYEITLYDTHFQHWVSSLMVITLDSHPGGLGSIPGRNTFNFCLKKYLKSMKNYYTKQINIVLYFFDFEKCNEI